MTIAAETPHPSTLAFWPWMTVVTAEHIWYRRKKRLLQITIKNGSLVIHPFLTGTWYQLEFPFNVPIHLQWLTHNNVFQQDSIVFCCLYLSFILDIKMTVMMVLRKITWSFLIFMYDRFYSVEFLLIIIERFQNECSVFIVAVWGAALVMVIYIGFLYTLWGRSKSMR